MQPLSHGGRVTLRLVEVTDIAVRYEGELATPSAQWAIVGRLTPADGAVGFEVAADVPAWLLEFTRTMLRTAWRSSRTGTPWPRRVTRWHDAPDEAR